MANVNGFDPVPWSVDGGLHPADLYRVEAYAASPGEGVASGPDCRVHQLSSPGTQVIIDAGAVRFLNRSAGVRNQMYVANGRAESRLDVAPTGASPRSDLVIVRAEDPQFPGWVEPDPEDAPTYQYAKPFIVQGVAAGTSSWKQRNALEGTPYSAYALARIDIPAGTSVITDAMIKDLRSVANPRSDRYINRKDHSAVTTDIVNGGSFAALPVTDTVFVPEWATWAFLRIDLSQTYVVTGPVTGLFHAQITDGVTTAALVNGNVLYKEDGPTTTRKNYFVNGGLSIPASLRGKTVTIQMLAQRTSGTGAVRSDDYTQFTFEMDFRERAA